MKFIYITTQKYPSSKVDPFFWQSMAESFNDLLGENFEFVVRNTSPDVFKILNVFSINAPNRMRSLWYLFKLPMLIYNKWNSPEVVFFSADPYLLSVLIFLRKIFRFRYQICSDWHQLFNDWRDKYVALNSDYLVSTSKRLKQCLVDVTKVTSDKIVVAYGGVDPSPYMEARRNSANTLRSKLCLPEDKFLIGYVGGFRSLGLEKGISLMIKALKYADSDVVMVFVGGRPDEIVEYKHLAVKELVSERVVFVIKQPVDRVVEYEVVMDALVIPYPDKPHFRDFGFPLKVWEYLASGQPIIYSNLEIIREVLFERATSFEPDNTKSLAKAIEIVKRDPELAKKQADNNVIEVKGYTWKSRAINILNFIKK